ncbi:hypothetical protein D3C87_1644930 [compost metagenome]
MGAERCTRSSTSSSSSSRANQEVKTSSPTAALMRARTRVQRSRWVEEFSLMTGSTLWLTEEEEGEAATDQSSRPAIACRIIVFMPCFVVPVRSACRRSLLFSRPPLHLRDEHHTASPERGNIARSSRLPGSIQSMS